MKSNKIVSLGLAFAGISLLAGGASAAGYWKGSVSGALDDPANWTWDGAEEITTSSTLRIRRSSVDDMYLGADLTVAGLEFGYNGNALTNTVNLGDGRSLSTGEFNIIDGGICRLTSGTITVTGNGRVGQNTNGQPEPVGQHETALILDGMDAKFVMENSKPLTVGYAVGCDNRVEVRNGATLSAIVRMGYNANSQNTLLVSGKGSLVETTGDVTIGAKSNTWGNAVRLTDGGTLRANRVYIGSETGSASNLLEVTSGAVCDVKEIHVGRNGAPGNRLVVSDVEFDASSLEVYLGPSDKPYANATVCVAGTNTYYNLGGRTFKLHDTQTLILDVTGPAVHSTMVKARGYDFKAGSKLIIKSSRNLSKVDDFETTALLVNGDGGLNIADCVIECDEANGLSYEIDGRDSSQVKLIVRHTKPRKKVGTAIFLR